MKTLNDEQLETFDTEYVNEARWKLFEPCIERDFPDGNFSFLDIGGGNGRFADRLLLSYPNSTAAVLDNSQLLLDKNQPNSRKTLIKTSVETLEHHLDKKYDLICLNWVLHHLVSDSYNKTRNNITSTLTKMELLLTPMGRVSIFENMYNGLIIDNLPSYLIYQLTSSKSIARFIRSQGANTAGVGVCFLSQKQWCSTIEASGLEILQYSDDEKWNIPWKRNVFLHIRNTRCGHFWLAPHKK
jgi:ubiquinone/menaquinone biosynthesis C-methylase UbiE